LLIDSANAYAYTQGFYIGEARDWDGVACLGVLAKLAPDQAQSRRGYTPKDDGFAGASRR